MTVVRGVKNRKFQFTQVLNTMLEDEDLSLKAKGFITYCLSKTDNWTFHISYLTSKLKEGERAIYSTIDECITLGYAIRYQPKKANGDFDSWETIISDCKEEIELIKKELNSDPVFQKSFTDRRFADAQVAHAQSVSLSNNNRLDIHEEQQQQQQSAAASFKQTTPKRQPSFYPCLEKIEIDSSEKEWLTRKYSEDIVIKALEWLKSPETKIGTTLIQAIKWACKEQPEIPRKKENQEEANKAYAMKYDGKKSGNCTIQVLNKSVEIDTGNSYTFVNLPFDAKGFMEQFTSALRKNNFEIIK